MYQPVSRKINLGFRSPADFSVVGFAVVIVVIF